MFLAWQEGVTDGKKGMHDERTHTHTDCYGDARIHLRLWSLVQPNIQAEKLTCVMRLLSTPTQPECMKDAMPTHTLRVRSLF